VAEGVERFVISQTPTGPATYKDGAGPWVHYSDYEKEKTRADELAATDEAQLENCILELEARAQKAEDALAETLADRDAAYKGEEIAQRERDQARQEVKRLKAERSEAIRVVGHRLLSHPLVTTMDEVHRNAISTVLDALLETGGRPSWKSQEEARQEVLEEVAAEFERRAKEQVKNEAEWVESKMAALTYEAAAAHCRGLATLDPSGEVETDVDRELTERAAHPSGEQGEEKCVSTIVDFLVSWRYCPVATAPNPSLSCLEDAAKQLLAALRTPVTDTSKEEADGSDRCGGSRQVKRWGAGGMFDYVPCQGCIDCDPSKEEREDA
jgi:hypothetical protein